MLLTHKLSILGRNNVRVVKLIQSYEREMNSQFLCSLSVQKVNSMQSKQFKLMSSLDEAKSEDSTKRKSVMIANQRIGDIISIVPQLPLRPYKKQQEQSNRGEKKGEVRYENDSHKYAHLLKNFVIRGSEFNLGIFSYKLFFF